MHRDNVMFYDPDNKLSGVPRAGPPVSPTNDKFHSSLTKSEITYFLKTFSASLRLVTISPEILAKHNALKIARASLSANQIKIVADDYRKSFIHHMSQKMDEQFREQKLDKKLARRFKSELEKACGVYIQSQLVMQIDHRQKMPVDKAVAKIGFLNSLYRPSVITLRNRANARFLAEMREKSPGAPIDQTTSLAMKAYQSSLQVGATVFARRLAADGFNKSLEELIQNDIQRRELMLRDELKTSDVTATRSIPAAATAKSSLLEMFMKTGRSLVIATLQIGINVLDRQEAIVLGRQEKVGARQRPKAQNANLPPSWTLTPV